MDHLLEGLAELIFEPFRLLIRWIVRSSGGSNPRHFRTWQIACWLFILLSVLTFIGTVICIVVGIIDPSAMLWLLLPSFVVFLAAWSALDALVWEPPSLNPPPESPQDRAEEGPSSRQEHR